MYLRLLCLRIDFSSTLLKLLFVNFSLLLSSVSFLFFTLRKAYETSEMLRFVQPPESILTRRSSRFLVSIFDLPTSKGTRVRKYKYACPFYQGIMPGY